MRLNIASRKSDLARLQAFRVGEALKIHFPELEINFQFKSSLGDQNLDDPLWKMPEKGVFTEDFVDDLLAENSDCIVHSWKDLPTEERPETMIIATQVREDMRDLFLFKKSSFGKPQLNVLTSSPRRIYNMSAFLPELLPFPCEKLEFGDIRGNIPTRLKKFMENNDADGLVLAKAALDRLLSAHQEEFHSVQKDIRRVLNECHFMVLPLSLNPAAAAQGALAIEIKKSRESELGPYFKKIHCNETYEDVLWERETLKSFGGGCHQKIGVSQFQREYGTVRFLKGKTDGGEVLDKEEILTSGEMPLPADPSKLWPQTPEDFKSLFTRSRLRIPYPENFQSGVAQVWIAKSTALPDEWPLDKRSLIWAAGLRTWKKLAKRGHWVSGCAESLGEQESEDIQFILGLKPAWIKLSHDGVEAPTTIATYELISNSFEVDLSGVTHIYWPSISVYKSLKHKIKDPEKVVHACGAGATYNFLQSQGIKAYPFLSFGHWLRHIQQREENNS